MKYTDILKQNEWQIYHKTGREGSKIRKAIKEVLGHNVCISNNHGYFAKEKGGKVDWYNWSPNISPKYNAKELLCTTETTTNYSYQIY